jgi:hypothetical protein
MFDVLFTFFSTFWFYLWRYKRSERRNVFWPRRLSTFWFYLWRHKRSERRKSIFRVLFGFRRSDFRSSDHFPYFWVIMLTNTSQKVICLSEIPYLHSCCHSYHGHANTLYYFISLKRFCKLDIYFQSEYLCFH